MIKELDCVALKVVLPEHGLAAGDVGAVVHVYKDSRAFQVEFTTYNGTTVANHSPSPGGEGGVRASVELAFS